MSTPRTSKGPWNYDPETGNIMSPEGRVAYVPNFKIYETALGDGSVLAAAPTMLGILEGVVDPKVREQMTDADWEMVRAVIAKAKGKS